MPLSQGLRAYRILFDLSSSEIPQPEVPILAFLTSSQLKALLSQIGVVCIIEE
jgi:hypothetical protein